MNTLQLQGTDSLLREPNRLDVIHDAVYGLVEVLSEMNVGVEMTALDRNALRKGTQAAYDRALIVLSGISDDVETAESLAQSLADSALHNPADRTVPLSAYRVDIANGESVDSKYRASYLSAGDTVEVFAHDEHQWRQAMILGALHAIDELLDRKGERATIAARALNSIATGLMVEDPSVNLDDAADAIFGPANWWKESEDAPTPAPAAEAAQSVGAASYKATLYSAGGTTDVSASNEEEWRHALALNASHAISDLLSFGLKDGKLSPKQTQWIVELNGVVNDILSGDDYCPLDEMADTVFGVHWEKDVACHGTPPADLSPTPEFARAAPHRHAANSVAPAHGGLAA